MYPKVHLYSGNNCGSLTCEGFDDQVPYYLSPSSPDYRGFDLNFNTTEGTVYWVAFELTDPVDYSFSALSSYGWHFAYTFYAEALAPPASLVNVAISDVVVTIVAKGVGDGTAIDSLDVDGAPCRNAVYTEGLAFSTTIECELDAAFAVPADRVVTVVVSGVPLTITTFVAGAAATCLQAAGPGAPQGAPLVLPVPGGEPSPVITNTSIPDGNRWGVRKKEGEWWCATKKGVG